MDKDKSEDLLSVIKELNEYMGNISSRMSGIDNTLDLMYQELKIIRQASVTQATKRIK